VRSFDSPLDAFKKSAEESKYITFHHLMNAPSKYRGKVITIKGTMARLRLQDASLLAKENGGVQDVYEAWVFGPTPHSNPFCVHFPILPEGLEPAETMRQEVTFYGYFLATFYEGAQKDDRPLRLVTPLLIGPTVVLGKKAAAAEMETPVPLVVLVAFVAFLTFLSVVFFVMYYWLERNARDTKVKLDEIKAKYAPAPFADEPDLRADDPIGTMEHPAASQVIFDGQITSRLPEAKPIDPERN